MPWFHSCALCRNRNLQAANLDTLIMKTNVALICDKMHQLCYFGLGRWSGLKCHRNNLSDLPTITKLLLGTEAIGGQWKTVTYTEPANRRWCYICKPVLHWRRTHMAWLRACVYNRVCSLWIEISACQHGHEETKTDWTIKLCYTGVC